MTATRDLRGDNIIDSRDVIARLEELETERQNAIETAMDQEDDTSVLKGESGSWTTANGTRVSEDWTEDQEDEYQAMKTLEDEGISEWRDGAALIRDSYFEDYAREFAEDIGVMENCDKWPATCIDWEQAARELQMDYTQVEFAGETYWVRS